MSRQSDWEKAVLVSVIILAIIALFKFLFWVSIMAIIVGVVWLVINFFSGDHDISWIPAVMIIGGIMLAFTSYQVGYSFEKSDLGKPIVDTAKTIVQTDNTIKEVEQNATNQIMGATQQAINEIQK